MRLPDFYKSEKLNRLKDKMGIPREVIGKITAPIQPGNATERIDKRPLDGTGIEVTFDDVQVLPDGTLAYQNSRVLLYIPEVSRFEPRFHLGNCRTLQEMRRQNRFGRYTVSANTSGLFSVYRNGNETPTNERLAVCQNCLLLLSYNGFRSDLTRAQKRRIVEIFDPEEFFRKYPLSLHSTLPAYTSETAPRNVYPPNFDEISHRERAAAGWRCRRCGRDLSTDRVRRFLHVHHKDGLKWNNIAINLEALCLGCHADEPNHAHMKDSPHYREFMHMCDGR